LLDVTFARIGVATAGQQVTVEKQEIIAVQIFVNTAEDIIRLIIADTVSEKTK
jgi:hypothetical protein